MNLKRKFHQELNQYPTPASPVSETHTATHTAFRPRKKWLTAPIAVTMAVLLTCGAAAAGVSVVRYLNRDTITENTLRLNEVPEGYVGIYTAEDLVQMRRDIENGTGADKYILMSDITFTDTDYAEGGICEGGWDPIDLHQYTYAKGDINDEDFIFANRPAGFSGAMYSGSTEYVRFHAIHHLECFNGNGHVIRNLRISADAVNALRRNEFGYDNDLYLGLFGNANYHRLEIINLGIEDCEITVTGESLDANDGSILIGAVAAGAPYVGACYVKNLTINIDLDTVPFISPAGTVVKDTEYNVMIGGIAGDATYLDACYTEHYAVNAKIDGHQPCVRFYGGGIGAEAASCLTCWSDGQWSIMGNALLHTEQGDIMPPSGNIVVPTVVPEESFELMQAALAEKLGENSFDYRMVRAYFVRKSLVDCDSEQMYAELKPVMDQWNGLYALATGHEGVYYDTLYVFDPTASPEETLRIKELLRVAFESDEEYRAFCTANSMIAGEIWCHVLNGESDMKESDFEGYDFATLWTLHDGKPRLRIFE